MSAIIIFIQSKSVTIPLAASLLCQCSLPIVLHRAFLDLELWPNLFCITSRRREGWRLQAGGKQWVKFAALCSPRIFHQHHQPENAGRKKGSYLPPVGEYDAESGDGEKAHRAHAGRHHHQAQAGSRGLRPRAVLHCLEVSYAWK